MSNVIGEAIIHVRAETTGAVAGAKTEGEAAGKEYSEGFAKNLKEMAKSILEILAVEKIFEFVKGSVEVAREAQKTEATTTALVKAAGAAAGVTAEHVDEYSRALSDKIGVDHDAIQSAANLVLAFHNVKNAAGEGNDVFDRTIAAGQDLAAAGFGSATTASKALAKSLNDPVAGMTALVRLGVRLTQTQQDQVKAFVASGDVLSAQKLILKQVEDRVGGVAAATATSADRSRVAFTDIKETIGKLLLPAIDSIEGAFADHVAPAILATLHGTNLLGRGAKALETVFKDAIKVIATLFGDGNHRARDFADTLSSSLGTGRWAVQFREGAREALRGFGDLERGVKDGIKKILPIIEDLAQVLARDIGQAVKNLAPLFAPLIKDALALVQSFRIGELHIAVRVLEGLGSALVAVTGFLAENGAVVRPIIVGVLAMVAAYKAYIAISKGVALIQGIITGVTAAYTVALGGEVVAMEEGSVAAKVFAATQAVLNAVMDANPIALVVIALVGLVAAFIYAYKHSETFRDIVLGVLDAIKGAFTAVVGFVVGFVEKHWGLLVSIMGGPLGIIVVQVIKHFDTIKAVISAVVGAVVGTLRQWGHFADGVIGAVKSVVNAVTGLPGKIAGIAGDMFQAGKTIITRLLDGIKAIGSGAGGIADTVLNAIKGAVNGMIDRLNSILEFSFNTHIPGVGTVTINPPDIGHLAAGTNNWRGGLSVVGERGPELAFLPRGTRVVPNNRTSQALGGMIDYQALAAALVAAGVGRGSITIPVSLPTGDPEAASMAVFNRLAAAGVV